jgi:hypothetical protein
VYADGTQLPPLISPDGNTQLFAGEGDSTFRVRGVLDLAGNPLAALELEGFDLDDFPFSGDGSPVENNFELDGTPFNASTPGFEEGTPFGWGVW